MSPKNQPMMNEVLNTIQIQSTNVRKNTEQLENLFIPKKYVGQSLEVAQVTANVDNNVIFDDHD